MPMLVGEQLIFDLGMATNQWDYNKQAPYTNIKIHNCWGLTMDFVKDLWLKHSKKEFQGSCS